MIAWSRVVRVLRRSAVVLVVVATGFAAPARTPAQTSDKTAAQDNSSAAQGKQGFSIESEMFTYSATDAESAMVACNIAQKLGATDRKCAPKSIGRPLRVCPARRWGLEQIAVKVASRLRTRRAVDNPVVLRRIRGISGHKRAILTGRSRPTGAWP